MQVFFGQILWQKVCWHPLERSPCFWSFQINISFETNDCVQGGHGGWKSWNGWKMGFFWKIAEKARILSAFVIMSVGKAKESICSEICKTIFWNATLFTIIVVSIENILRFMYLKLHSSPYTYRLDLLCSWFELFMLHQAIIVHQIIIKVI